MKPYFFLRVPAKKPRGRSREMCGWMDRWLGAWMDGNTKRPLIFFIFKHIIKWAVCLINICSKVFSFFIWAWTFGLNWCGRTPFSILSTFFYNFVPNLSMIAGGCTLTYSLRAPARDSQESQEVQLFASHTKCDCARNTCIAKKAFLVVVIENLVKTGFENKVYWAL